MKKIFSILTLAFLIAAVPANAQPGKDFFNLGVKAGLNFSNMSGVDDMFADGFLKTYTGFNAGLVFNFNLPLGFEINPELQYVQSGFRADGGTILGQSLDSRFVSGAVRIPINVQWGIRFLSVVKPYETFATTDELRARLAERPLEGYHILLKGSHAMALESLIELL